MPVESDEIKEEVRKRKANKTRKTLKRVIIVCLVLLVCAAGVGAYFLFTHERPTSTIKDDTAATSTDQVVDAGPSGAQVLTDVPALASLFGKTPDQAVALLPSGSSIVSTSPGTDPVNPDITTIVDISVAPTSAASAGTSTKGNAGNADLYLSLNADNLVVKAYYAVPLGDLGNADVDFSKLLANNDFINQILTDAGTGVSDFVASVPAKEQYQTSVKASDGTTKVSKETFTYSGMTKLGVAPTTWAVTFTFDYASVNVTGSADDLTRMMYLSLA